MFSKKYLLSFAAIALMLLGTAAVFAQTAPLRGRVEVKKADGTVEPVAGATVDVYRTDAKGKPGDAKTDKKGSFAFAGLPVGQVFAVVVSGPGIRPDIFPGIKAGAEDMKLTVSEGDGRALTEEEVRTALASSANQPPVDSEQAKKEKAEYDKKVAEVNARNEKVKKATDVINASLKEGNAAYEAKNYDLAIAKFDEGYNADPDFIGSAPVMLNNKSIALRLRGFNHYKQSTTDTANKASHMEKAKADWLASVDSSNRALTLLKGAASPEEQKNVEANKFNALSNLIEVYRLMILTKADTSKAKEANEAYTQYLAAETDATKKTKAELQLGDIMRESGEADLAIAAYRKVLEMQPDNADAMAGLGLSLFDRGVTNNNKAQMQEGLNFMQKFADTAPATHPLKASVKDAVDYLKNQEKLAPQKVTTTKKKN